MSETQPERRGPLAQQAEKACKEEPQPWQGSPRKWGRTSGGHHSGYTKFQHKIRETQESIGFTRALFAEELDVLVMSATDGNIYLWEFESFIPSTESPSEQFFPVFGEDSRTLTLACADGEKAQDPSSKCVAGFTCLTVLCGHIGMITALTLTGTDPGINAPYLLSGGWDGKLCLWNLQNNSLQNAFSSLPGNNGPILDIAYSPKSTGGVFVCSFNPHSANLVLLAELCGHKAAVIALVWHPLEDKWVSGAEDGSIRLWSEEGGCCVLDLRAPSRITCLCIDQTNGCIIAGVHDTIRVYDSKSGVQVQSYTGHQDSIRGLIHVPETEQYVSVSLDGTACTWKAFRQGK